MGVATTLTMPLGRPGDVKKGKVPTVWRGLQVAPHQKEPHYGHVRVGELLKPTFDFRRCLSRLNPHLGANQRPVGRPRAGFTVEDAASRIDRKGNAVVRIEGSRSFHLLCSRQPWLVIGNRSHLLAGGRSDAVKALISDVHDSGKGVSHLKQLLAARRAMRLVNYLDRANRRVVAVRHKPECQFALPVGTQAMKCLLQGGIGSSRGLQNVEIAK